MTETKAADVAAEAKFLVGPLDSIEDADDAACRLLGYARSELVGMHGSDLVPPERHGRTAVSLDRMRQGDLTSREGLLRRKDGVVLTIRVEARVLGAGRLLLTVRERRTPWL